MSPRLLLIGTGCEIIVLIKAVSKAGSPVILSSSGNRWWILRISAFPSQSRAGPLPCGRPAVGVGKPDVGVLKSKLL